MPSVPPATYSARYGAPVDFTFHWEDVTFPEFPNVVFVKFVSTPWVDVGFAPGAGRIQAVCLQEPRDESSLELELPALDDLRGESEFVLFDGDDEEFNSKADGSRAKRVLEFDSAEERLDVRRPWGWRGNWRGNGGFEKQFA
ncbi:hypothetical protein NL676_018457 [Syzygium grande]|nr:hypothetical protein NL676_018457 [Syzygium grande]